ncbi:MAG: histidine phosphatase family protein [Anaerolineae bacterium]
MTTTLLLVRHGQTAWNSEERFRGRTDLPLDDLGVRQAEALARLIERDYVPAAVLTSPLQRAVQTAAPIAVSAEPAMRAMETVVRSVGGDGPALSLSIRADRGLMDLDYGVWSGLTTEEAEEHYPDLYAAWMERPNTVRFPGGEALVDVRERAMELVGRLLNEYAEQEIVLVTHLMVCRVLLCALLDIDLDHYSRFRVDNASLTRLDVERGVATLITANETCHLRGIGH